MKKLISLLMTIAVLLSVLQPAWAIEEAAEIDAVAASRNLIVVVPGIIGSELVDGNGAKVWVGVGGILGQIQCNEVGNPVYPLYAYNNDNYGARDTYKTLYDSLKSRYSSQADVKFFAYDWRKTNTRAGQALKSMVNGYSGKIGNVKKCAVGKHPKSEKHGNTAQFSEVERSGTQENCGGIGLGCRLRLRPLPVLRRRQSQRVARIDPNAVVVDKNIAENDRFDLFSR